MNFRSGARWSAVAALITTLAVTSPAVTSLAVTAPTTGTPTNPANRSLPARTEKSKTPLRAYGKSLPACTPGSASTRPPAGPAGPGARGACRTTGHIQESAVRLVRPGQLGFTPSGYHHLGANSAGEWSGVSGRMSVVDGSVRPGSYDFVAGRFMAKRPLAAGKIAWLEAGWAETGWASAGRQHIYTFNTNTRTWQFYDQYALRPGDKVWIDLHSDADGIWAAWLWWDNRWNLLTAQRLPIGADAYIEQYVEVHVDAGSPTRVDVPAVTVDNVQLRPPGGGASRYWRADVPTLTGGDPAQQQRSGGFCLDWVTRYDTWTAGDCGGEGGGLLAPAANPQPTPSGDAEVVTARPATPNPSTPAQPTPPAASRPADPPLLDGLLESAGEAAGRDTDLSD